MILGSGGVGRAVILTLVEHGVERLLVANRTLERAKLIVNELDSNTNVGVCSLGSQPILDASASVLWDLIVNCTTLGMRYTDSETLSPISADNISSGTLVYDLVYNPPVTSLLKLAVANGADTLGGLGMLIYQGAEAFRLWTQKTPDISIMFQSAREAIY